MTSTTVESLWIVCFTGLFHSVEVILNEWIHAVPNPIFHLPFKNPFIPHNLTVIDENKNGDENEIPVLV